MYPVQVKVDAGPMQAMLVEKEPEKVGEMIEQTVMRPAEDGEIKTETTRYEVLMILKNADGPVFYLKTC